MSAATPPIRHAPIALWRVAESFLHILHNLFGAPEDVAVRHTLMRGPYALMLSWIQVGEALLRRLLLIEAAALPEPNTRPILWQKRQRKRRVMEFFDDKPEDWRVSFRCIQSCTLRQAQRDAVSGEAKRNSVTLSLSKGDAARFHSTWPLAERYEALIRVFNDPTAYAKRLAKRLYARGVAVSALLRAPPQAKHRIDRFDELETHADTAADHFLNSS